MQVYGDHFYNEKWYKISNDYIKLNPGQLVPHRQTDIFNIQHIIHDLNYFAKKHKWIYKK